MIVWKKHSDQQLVKYFNTLFELQQVVFTILKCIELLPEIGINIQLDRYL